MPSYNVQDGTITKTEIRRLLNPAQVPNFERIVIQMVQQGTSSNINIDVFAEDVAGTRLTNVAIVLDSHSVNLGNNFIPDFGQFCKITKAMITAFGDPELELKARKHHYKGTGYPPHTNKHFIGYKVKIKP